MEVVDMSLLVPEITELGRRIQFPSSWFSSERKQAIIWYHAVQAFLGFDILPPTSAIHLEEA
eukprot:1140082-Pelagomonas_calceolata.AAC.1